MNSAVKVCTHQNAIPILHEIKHALLKLAENNQATTIDLSSLPMTSQDTEQLLSTLGKGEVNVTLTSAGESTFWETQFPGVWVTQHQPHFSSKQLTYIEICLFPSLLMAQQADITDGLNRLQEIMS
ncbi:MAG: hydrogenase accessory protein HupE [Methylococcales bacterium]|jgi:hydrogenase-1 operon protein HyaF|nr:hydrogenase accessory protein HupE [Methylococcales bacterium]MBT7445108.1 hydrogenase accessory protein HupE [Methylococcales bacterium]